MRNLARALVAILSILLLISCGADAGSKPNLSSSPSIQPSLSNNPTVIIPSPTLPIVFNTHQMHIESSSGILCLGYPNEFQPRSSSTGNLVLATNRLGYDAGEIQQMKTYVETLRTGNSALPPLPSTLSWVPGGLICTLIMQITNTGTAPIQLHSMYLKLLNVPQRNNNRHYSLVDLCPLSPNEVVCPGLAGGAGVNFGFQLDARNTSVGQLIPAQTSVSGDVTIPSAPQNDVEYLQVEIASGQNPLSPVTPTPSSTPQNYIYSVMPELVVTTQAGPQNIPLPQLSATLYFAAPDQFSCYTLRGSTFVLLKSPDYMGNDCI